ncbi:MAG: IS30 family transposase, partial [SAR324 cluster bacterium]|nr:IS30 family transposase [SAR324 cluster bacterium]
SHEWIYQYFLKDKSQAGDLYTHLRLRKKRKKRYGSQNRKGVFLSLVERKSRLCLIARLANKSAQEEERTTINLLDSIKEKVQTVTSDNGKEFAKHESIAKNLDAQFFFAHPDASWERGLNENTNGLIRQYFPKKT